MRHIAYPNIAPNTKPPVYHACVRYVSMVDAPGPPYTMARPNTTHGAAVKAGVRRLVPAWDDAALTVELYEKVDTPGAFRGPSQELAYFLALIRCVHRLVLDGLEDVGDLWCTGAIELAYQLPVLSTVNAEAFRAKLEGFLSQAPQDRIFLVPDDNIYQAESLLCRAHGVQVLTLEDFSQQLATALAAGVWRDKVVVRVNYDQLPQLVEILFARPPVPHDPGSALLSPRRPYKALAAFDQAAEVASGLLPELTTYLRGLSERLGDLPWFYPPDMPFDRLQLPVQVSQVRLQHGSAQPARWASRHRGNRLPEAAEAYTAPAPRAVVRAWDEVREEVFQRGAQGAVILGDPGFGKTHLLHVEGRRLAQQSLKHLEEKGSAGVTLPIFARLVDLVDDPDRRAIEEVLGALLRRQYGLSETCVAWIRPQLSTSACVLLLDGWDEVPPKERDLGESASLACRLAQFAHHASCRSLVTSRTTGYSRPPLFLRRGAGPECELVAFDAGQSERFIEAWFDGQPDKGQRLLQALRQSPQLTGLAQIPLLLSFLCRLFEEREAALPTRRVALYEACLYGLLQRWPVERHGHEVDRAYVDAKLELLGEVALGGLQAEERLFSVTFLRHQVEGFLDRLAPSHPLYGRPSHDVLAELTYTDGVLIDAGPQDNAHVLFLHQSFQDYLAARALARQDTLLEEVTKHLWCSPAWQEVVVLAAALLPRPEELIAGLRATPDDIFHTGLFLAGRCAAECEADGLPQKLVQQIWEDIFQLMDKVASQELRQPGAQVLAALARSSRTGMHRLHAALQGLNPRKGSRLLSLLKELHISRAELIAPLVDFLKNSRSMSFRFEAVRILSNLECHESLDDLYTAWGWQTYDPKIMKEVIITQDSDRETFLAFVVGPTKNRWSWVCLWIFEVIELAAFYEPRLRLSLATALPTMMKGMLLGTLFLGAGLSLDKVLAWQAGVLRRCESWLSRHDGAMLTSAHPQIRMWGTSSCARRSHVDPQDLAMLAVVARRDDHPLVRLSAARALVKLGHATPEVIGIVLTAARHGDPRIRAEAVETLAEVPGVPAWLARLEALGDKSATVSEVALAGLVQPLHALLCDPRAADSTPTRERGPTEAFQHALRPGDLLLEGTPRSLLEGLPFLLEASLAAGEIRREAAVSTLHSVLRSHPQGVAALGQMLQTREGLADADSPGSAQHEAPCWERMRAIEALGQRGQPDREVLDALLEIIRRDNNLWVCTKALDVLQRFTPLDPQTITNLSQAAFDESDEVREKAIEVLGQLGDADHPGLTAAMLESCQHDPSPQVRRAAASVLRAWGQTDAPILAVLLQAVGDREEEEQVRREAAHALGELGDEDTLMDLCQLWVHLPWGKRAVILPALASLSARFKRKIHQAGRRRLSATPLA